MVANYISCIARSQSIMFTLVFFMYVVAIATDVGFHDMNISIGSTLYGFVERITRLAFFPTSKLPVLDSMKS